MDNTLREKVYQKLGLKIGSLKSEGGRDWNDAIREIQAEEAIKFPYTNDGTYTEEVRARHQKSADEMNEEYRKIKRDQKRKQNDKDNKSTK